jgi:opacity protein-like surface antigen
MEIALNPMFSLDFGYRYFKTTKGSFDTYDDYFNQSTEMRFQGHNVAVGFRMKY